MPVPIRTAVTPLQRGRSKWPKLLKDARAARGLSQAEAAERINTPLRTWINWENGNREPRSATAELLRREFSINF